MRRRRNTKIVATLGPASNTMPVMKALFEAGVDVFRINMSHTPHDLLARMHADLRALSVEVGRPVGILVDLQGPKIRLGTIPGGARMLKEDERVKLVLGETSDNEAEIPIPHQEIFQAIKQKHALLIDDGKVRLRLLRKADTFAEAIVEVGGEIKNRKGVNMPDTLLPMSAMTPKDRSDLDAALALGVDWIALSFVQRPEDVAELKKIVAGRAGVLAKIEKPKALITLDRILELADALMVARGDLGVEMPLERVPGLQKQITRAARKAGKPVVVATQMLESMISSPMPTRAEVSDVATAVYDGADAVMLSAESAAGQYPVEAVQTMDRIATAVEADPLYREFIESQRGKPERTTPDAIMAAVHEVTQTIDAKAIVCWTKSGITAMRAARERSVAPIIAPTPSLETARRLCLVWGTHSVLTEDIRDFDDMVRRASEIARQEGFAQGGERIVITAGVPLGTTGATNMLRVAFASDEHSVLAPAMKRIGILGGSSDQATADYYRRLNAAVNARLGGWNTAELLINSMNFQFVTDCIREERWDEIGTYLTERSLALQQAGCDLLLCVSNTLHRMAPMFTRGLSIPFLHIVDPTAAAIRAQGLTRVALFGTKPVMATDFIKLHYAGRFGIDILVPSPDEQDTIDRIIFDELCKGQFTDAARTVFLDIADRIRHQGAEGLILGCTEIPLLIAQKDRPDFPMFDTVALHVEAAVEFALG